MDEFETPQYTRYIPLCDYPPLGAYSEAAWYPELSRRCKDFQRRKEQLTAQLEELGLAAEFHERLLRRNAMETGQIEGLYDLDRGTTETLIEQGISAALISHNDAKGQDVETLTLQVQDQRDVLEDLFALVKRTEPLTLAHIRDLHQKLCAHQDYIWVSDPQGKRARAPLLKGQWKEAANNPQRDDGSLFHYCPPEQVQTEMDYLLQSISLPAKDSPQAILLAAYLHHRFTLVHPFQDGNGRMARVLASLVLIQRQLYPMLVDRDQRHVYLAALESADQGLNRSGGVAGLEELCSFMLASQEQSLSYGEALYKENKSSGKNLGQTNTIVSGATVPKKSRA
ncbi:MAG: Fic family protein [Spirochaetota bacterium]